MNKNIFAKEVEKLISPMTVGALHFIQPFNKLLPKFLQDYFVKSSSSKFPHMGFVVEPYCTFLCYEINDINIANSLLPYGFELVKTKIKDNDEPKFYGIFGCFTAHTSAFWGSRVEFYLIAENKSTGLLSWIIVDYDSNTISYDHKYGLRSPNSSKAVVTTNCDGEVLVDIKRDDKSREIVYDIDIKNCNFVNLDKRLWLEGNLSIGYGNELANGDVGIFSLKFFPSEVEKGLDIPLGNLKLISNTWYPNLFHETPSEVLCFPYAQHFLSDSPDFSSNLRNEKDLMDSINKLDFENMKTISAETFKNMFILSSLVSLVVTVVLIVLLILK